MRQKNISDYECAVNYRGETYRSRGNIFLNNVETARPTIVTADKVPYDIMTIFKFEETEDELILHKGKLVFNVDEDDEVEFLEKYDQSVRVNKVTKETIKGFDFKKEFSRGDNYSMKNIVSFLNKVMLLKNPYVFNELAADSLFLLFYSYKQNIILKNLFNLIVDNIDGFEKILKINKRFLEENIHKENFEIGNEGKLNKVVQLPKFAIQYIKEKKLEQCYDIFKSISSEFDGNNLKILLDFFEDMKIFIKQSNRENIIKSFSLDVYYLMKEYKYKITDLLGYLVKQNFNYGKSELFSFPIDEIKELKDYLDMCKKYGLSYEKMPQYLERQHNIVMKNVRVLEKTKNKENAFKDAVSDYKWMEHKDKEYSIIVPKDINDLIQEGNYLHHCVGSYADKVINKQSLIFFMRQNKELQVPYITIEVLPDFTLSEARGMYNTSVEGEEFNFIKRWVRASVFSCIKCDSKRKGGR